MKDGDAMAALLKLRGGELSDKTAAADKKYFHICIPNLPGLKPDSLDRFTRP